MLAKNTASQPANINIPFLEVIRATALGARRVEEGCSNDIWDCDLLLPDDSNAQAYVKDIPLREVAQELLGSALAYSCGLPVPRAFLVIAEHSIIDADFAHDVGNGTRLLIGSERRSAPPLGRRLKNGILTQEALQAFAKWPHCGATLAFDTWTANTDRHEYNVLFEGADDIWLIDHGNCFCNSFWNPGSLDPLLPYKNRMAEWLCPNLSSEQLQNLRSSVLRLCAEITRMDVEAVGQASRAFDYLALEVREAIVKFLRDRAPLTPQITGAQTGIEGLLLG